MKQNPKRENKLALVPVEQSALELTCSRRPGGRALTQALRRVDLKRLALAAGGTAAAVSAVSLIGKRCFYKGIVSAELKKQLAIVNGKLDNLQMQNEQLCEELARLKKEA